MANAPKELKDKRLYLRVSPPQREAIQEAANIAHKDVTTFVLDAAITSAERVLADRRLFSLPRQQWDAFLSALDRPAPGPDEKPRLRKLMETPSILER